MAKLWKILGLVAGVFGAGYVAKKVVDNKKSKKTYAYESAWGENYNQISNYAEAKHDENEATFSEISCPRCGAKLCEQRGFSPDLRAFICKKCGQAVLNPKYDDECVWFCDSCNAILNNQKGWPGDQHCHSFKCTNCGFENDITSDNIREHEEPEHDYDDDDDQENDERFDDLLERDFDSALRELEDYSDRVSELESEYNSIQDIISHAIPYFGAIGANAYVTDITNGIHDLENVLFDIFSNEDHATEKYDELESIVNHLKSYISSIYICGVNSLESLIDEKENELNLLSDNYKSYDDKEEYTCCSCWKTFKSPFYSSKCPSCLEEDIEEIKNFKDNLSDFEEYLSNLSSTLESINI